MKKNPIETILGLCVFCFAVLFLIYITTHIDTTNVSGYTVKANFAKVGGIGVGADVRISGIKVGSVLKTQLNDDDFTADLWMTIDSNVRLPIDTEAAIADVGIMGDKYVRLTPGKAQAVLNNGDSIRYTRNYRSLEDSVSEFIFLSTK